MNNLLYTLFGEGENLTVLQMALRAFVMFFITLTLIRITGMRALGQKSPFDSIIVIMLGAILSRAVVGASPFISTVAAGSVMALVHKLLAMLSVKSTTVGYLIKGEKRLLYTNGEFIYKNMMSACISHKDLLEGARIHLNENKLDNVAEIYMERSGKISFVKKQP